jgi:hypothetical protein
LRERLKEPAKPSRKECLLLLIEFAKAGYVVSWRFRRGSSPGKPAGYKSGSNNFKAVSVEGIPLVVHIAKGSKKKLRVWPESVTVVVREKNRTFVMPDPARALPYFLTVDVNERPPLPSRSLFHSLSRELAKTNQWREKSRDRALASKAPKIPPPIDSGGRLFSPYVPTDRRGRKFYGRGPCQFCGRDISYNPIAMWAEGCRHMRQLGYTYIHVHRLKRRVIEEVLRQRRGEIPPHETEPAKTAPAVLQVPEYGEDDDERVSRRMGV